MKTYLFLLLGLLLCSTQSIAQKTATLQVIIKAAKPDSIINVTVQLFRLPDTLLVKSKVTTSPTIEFSVNTFSKYLVRLSGVAIENTEKVIGITDKPASITFTLKRKNTTLQNVVVVSKKPLFKQEDDKTIVDATVLANSSTNAFEVLEKTPGVIVDQDGNVYLNSLTPSTVFINGREMKLSSADIASLLKSLPAGSVSKIEILRNPSAKYDAASSGGIINIVLKKGVNLGSSGSVNAGYFQGIYSTQTAGFNINKSFGKINSYFSYQFTGKNNYEALNSDRLITKDSSLLSQKSFTTYPAINNYLSGGLDIAFTKKFNVGYDLRLSYANNRSYAVNAIDITKDPIQLLLGKNRSDINNKTNTLFFGNNISSKYKIDTLGSEWTALLDYNYYSNTNSQVYTNNSFLPAKPAVLGDGKTSNFKNIFVAQTDLTLKLPKIFTLETGVKATFSNSLNSAAYFTETGSSGRQVDVYQTNTFKYKESIVAAYLQLSRTLLGFTIKPGLRLETTQISGRQSIPKDTSLNINRTDLFPYVFISHKLFKLFGIQLIGNAIYRRSIKRPYYEILNPYPKYIDQYLFDVGNPGLQPQFTTNYEVNVTFNNFPVLAAGINQTKDIFSSVTYQDDITKIAYRTYDNLGKSKEYYFRVIGGIPPGGKYFFYVGVQHNYIEYNGFYQNLPLNYKRGSWLFFLYQELKASKTITVNMQGFMRTKALQNFYELNTFGGLFFSVNKSILKKKANIILSVNDLLSTNQVSFNLNQGNVLASGSRINDTRRFGITLRYNFGLSKPKENKEFGTPVESKDN